MIIKIRIKFSKLQRINLILYKKFLIYYFLKNFNNLFFFQFVYMCKTPIFSLLFIPQKKSKITILRSPHIYKKAKENFFVSSHILLISISNFLNRSIFNLFLFIFYFYLFLFLFFSKSFLDFYVIKKVSIYL